MAHHSIETALKRVPPPPCDNGCGHKQRCAERQMSCKDFGRYVQGVYYYSHPDRRIPSRAQHERIYHE